eukprot:snap_masked-scaffold_24-processed-gene-4.28-mRNA-1 protein AED:1.00 eAED:1.00 QI:0/0/0/0/1/1/2/0/70
MGQLHDEFHAWFKRKYCNRFYYVRQSINEATLFNFQKNANLLLTWQNYRGILFHDTILKNTIYYMYLTEV